VSRRPLNAPIPHPTACHETLLAVAPGDTVAAGGPAKGAGECLVLGVPLTAPGGRSDTGLMVSGMAERPIRYDVTVTRCQGWRLRS
jgi:hypothetical protein